MEVATLQSRADRVATASARGELISAGRRLSAGGLAYAKSGNVSALAGDHVLITVAGARLGALRPRDIVAVAPKAPRGHGESSELPLHATIYRNRPDVGAIVHFHSPYATAWSCLGEPLPLLLEEARYYGMPSLVPVAPHAPGGSHALARASVEALGAGAAVLLERHGAVSVGRDAQAALDIAESLEHQAKVAWLLRADGCIALVS